MDYRGSECREVFGVRVLCGDAGIDAIGNELVLNSGSRRVPWVGDPWMQR
jgi:hypothetical protein